MTAALQDLLARVEATQPDVDLNEQVALALGWREQKRTNLGLRGRTPGNWGWAAPEHPWGWQARLPNLLGPRNCIKTIADLRALISQHTEKTDG